MCTRAKIEFLGQRYKQNYQVVSEPRRYLGEYSMVPDVEGHHGRIELVLVIVRTVFVGVRSLWAFWQPHVDLVSAGNSATAGPTMWVS